jgi:mono/diheme cytochrome c family protein
MDDRDDVSIRDPIGADEMKSLRILSLALVLGGAALVFAGSTAKPAASPAQVSAPNELNQQWMVEGEKRYRTNCGRCHQSPHKFPAREMAMAVRHMRVRAMLTEDDMKYVLYYVTH